MSNEDILQLIRTYGKECVARGASAHLASNDNHEFVRATAAALRAYQAIEAALAGRGDEKQG